ncbi:MAG: SET domain-containing protein-lysine N-methyltransferase [Phycisphaeraceae bacterium]|nr:SET domain-containing protein-lysine N-methyltransferase [Phycisphaeraceae bacterium]
MSDDPCIRHPGLEIRRSPLHGLGVFTAEPIPAGHIIEQSPCLPLEQGWEKMPTVLNHYLFAWPYEGDGRAVGFGIASLFNHGQPPNVTWATLTKTQRLEFRAARDIQPGEELLIDYGPEFWQNARKYPTLGDQEQRSIHP